MSDWKLNPFILTDWPPEVDYVLAIDENGTPDLKSVVQAPNDLLQWFTISGVLLNRDNFSDSRDKISKLKKRFWKDGLYNGERVVFHSRDIRKKTGPFNPKKIDYPAFTSELYSLISELDFNIYSSSIDKFAHGRQYINPYPVYDLCLEFVIERFCRELERTGNKGIIVMESRGKKENRTLLNTAVNFMKNGNRYHDPSFFSSIHSLCFNPKRTYDKQLSFPQLEIADMISYPIHKFIRTGERDFEYISIEDKIYNFPDHLGYGMKIFPKNQSLKVGDNLVWF